jgi:glycosyltransferase involved in cell wall biosynthesis
MAVPERRLRILMVGPSLEILGGQAVQASRLLAGLRECDELRVDFLPVNPQLPGPLRHLQRVKYVRTVVTSVWYLLSLLRTVPRYDLVHAFSASYYSFLLAPLPAMLVSRLFGKPALLNYRSGEASDHLANWPLSRGLLRRFASKVVVPSDYLVRVFAIHGIDAIAISNFVPADVLPYRQRSALVPRLFSNRNLEPLYNVECTLRGFALVQQRVPSASLAIVGDGSERPRLESLARSLGLRNVEFVGRVPPDHMAGFYDRGEIYVNSPNIDNMPSSILEAFACGLPVVTTDAGGIPFIVDDGRNGLMVRVGDSEALAAAVLRLVEEPGLAALLAHQARQECLARYAWPVIRDHWRRCYRYLAQDSGVRADAAS